MSNIEKYKGGQLLPALTNDPTAVLEAIAENIGSAGLSASNLTRIKVPSGGGTFFEIPSLDGVQAEKELIGTIVFHHSERRYYDRPFDEAAEDDRMPTCQSADGLLGIGKPGGSCQACALSKFGSSPGKNGQPGKGQACSERKTLYMIRGEQMIPDLVSIPPTSLAPCTDFLFSLAKSGIKFHQALVSISLKKEKNAAGVEYAEMEFRYLRKLSQEESPNALAWNGLMKTFAADAAESRKRMIAEGGAA